jgi:hypothetical protein
LYPKGHRGRFTLGLPETLLRIGMFPVFIINLDRELLVIAVNTLLMSHALKIAELTPEDSLPSVAHN